ncbi:MAG: polysaccharide biosynthesis tyrosine autokinase [Bacteroidia bacterium]|nr:polysaccharide biosynthesis tyrosine autokinase [Bacteroidia bacterium]
MPTNPVINKRVSNDELDLGKIFTALAAKWYYFLIAVILFVSAALFYLSVAVPTFEATSSIIVKETLAGGQGASLDLISGDMFVKQTNVANVKSILTSNTTISEVIKRLQLLNTVYDNSGFVGRPLYKTSPIKVDSANLNKWYYNSQKFYITVLDENSYKLSFKYDGSVLPYFEHNKVYRFGDVVKTEYFSFRVMRNQAVPLQLETQKEFYVVCKDIVTRTGDIISNITTTSPDKTSTIIGLTYKDHSTQLCVDVLNTISQVFLENELNLKRGEAFESLKFVDKQLEESNTKLQQIEEQLRKYKSENGIIDLTSQGKSISDNIGSIDRQKYDNDSKIKNLDALYNSVKNNADVNKISPSGMGINDPSMEALIRDYQELVTKIQGLETAVLSPTPQLKAYKQQLETKRSSLLETISSIKEQLVVTGRGYQDQIGRLQGSISAMPEKEKGLIEIQRQRDVTQQLYEYLLQKKQETMIATQTASASNRVQDPAVVGEKPVAPVKPLILAIAILMSFILPSIIVFIQNVARKTVSNRDDIDNATTIPVLGVIGKMRGSNNNYVYENPKSIVAECFRSLRTNIQLAEINNEKQVIMITSTVAGEGKSFTALNLAVMFAMQSNKTLLLGFDFRKPRLYRELGMHNDTGLSTYLNGKANIETITQKTNVEGLDLITAGPIPENPSELLAKDSMKDFFAHVRGKYDYIIVDTPPIGVLSDAYVIMKYADLNLYVIREGYSNRAFIKSLDELNLEGKVWNMQIVLNAAGLGKKFNANYGHYHGYAGKYRYYADNEEKPGFFKRMFGRE